MAKGLEAGDSVLSEGLGQTEEKPLNKNTQQTSQIMKQMASHYKSAMLSLQEPTWLFIIIKACSCFVIMGKMNGNDMYKTQSSKYMYMYI
jgi:hypothetical protein